VLFINKFKPDTLIALYSDYHPSTKNLFQVIKAYKPIGLALYFQPAWIVTLPSAHAHLPPAIPLNTTPHNLTSREKYGTTCPLQQPATECALSLQVTDLRHQICTAGASDMDAPTDALPLSPTFPVTGVKI